MRVEGDSRRLDGDASILLVFPRIREPRFACFGGGDNARTLDEGVGQGGLAMVDCTNSVSEPVQLVREECAYREQ